MLILKIPPHTHTHTYTLNPTKQTNKPMFKQRAMRFAARLILLILNPVYQLFLIKF